MSDRVCKIPLCGEKHYGRGWCLSHWRRWYRTGDPLPKPRPSTRRLPKLRFV